MQILQILNFTNILQMLSSGDTSVVCLQTHYSNSLDINDPKATTHEMHNRLDEVR